MLKNKHWEENRWNGGTNASGDCPNKVGTWQQLHGAVEPVI